MTVKMNKMKGKVSKQSAKFVYGILDQRVSRLESAVNALDKALDDVSDLLSLHLEKEAEAEEQRKAFRKMVWGVITAVASSLGNIVYLLLQKLGFF